MKFSPTLGVRITTLAKDRPTPGISEVWRADPNIVIPSRTRELIIYDRTRWSRRVLFPVVRLLSRLLVALTVMFKRLLPVEFSFHGAIDWLCVRFMRRFVSHEGVELLLRHFIIETNLLAFIAVHSSEAVPVAKLRPLSIEELGNSAVIEHDVAVFDLLGSITKPLAHAAVVDNSALRVESINPSPHKKWLNLDIETALYLMNIPFSLFLTNKEYERAVHSLALDSSLMESLYRITGIVGLRGLTPEGNQLLVRTSADVPRSLYIHAIIHEVAHELLVAPSR